jgi:hypothetical protein
MPCRAIFSAAFLFWIVAASAPAEAHCDGIDGPVATAAARALETGNVNLALPYAPVEAETEIIARFEEARRVRARGREARSLADRAFIEAVVRLHRVGEGASYTGLGPAGADYGPVIPPPKARWRRAILLPSEGSCRRKSNAGCKTGSLTSPNFSAYLWSQRATTA